MILVALNFPLKFIEKNPEMLRYMERENNRHVHIVEQEDDRVVRNIRGIMREKEQNRTKFRRVVDGKTIFKIEPADNFQISKVFFNFRIHIIPYTGSEFRRTAVGKTFDFHDALTGIKRNRLEREV